MLTSIAGSPRPRSYIESQTGYRFTHPIVITDEDRLPARLYSGLTPPVNTPWAPVGGPCATQPIPAVGSIFRVLEGRTGIPFSGDWDVCLIVVADAWRGLSEAAKLSNIAHEVYHCYQREKNRRTADITPLGEGRFRQLGWKKPMPGVLPPPGRKPLATLPDR